MKTEKRYSPEFHQRAVRLVQELQKDGHSEWSAIQSISQKLGFTPESVAMRVH
jgi:transposase